MSARRAAAWPRVAVLVLAALAGWSGHLAAQQPFVRTVLDNGPSASRYDMVILGDGYTAAEQGRFDLDVTRFLTGLFAKAPYSTFGSYFNVHTVFRASAESGASHPDVAPPIVRNTAYGSSYDTGGTDRCLYIQNTAQALIDAALAPANEARVIVIVNDDRYGGCAGQFAVSYNGALMPEVQSHEVGHSLAQLADEYDYPNLHYTGPEPANANVTKDPLGSKWAHWWGTDSVSAYEGAGYHLTGLYRPRHDCLMRSLGTPICPVCREQTARAINAVVDTIEAPQPAGSVVLTAPAPQSFSFTNLVPATNNARISWSVDGAVVPGQTGTAFVFDSGSVAPGAHTITARVEDRTGLVRSDPAGLMVDMHSWSVTVVDATATNLLLTSSAAGMQRILPGTDAEVRLTLLNLSPTVTTGVTIDHFLSYDASIGPSDLWLGGEVVPALQPGELRALTYAPRVPNLVRPGIWRILSVVDRGQAIVETNEADNTAETSLQLLTGQCSETLEFRDPGVYPRDTADVSIAAGGAILPTVTSRCAVPGAMYVIVWGSSGTAPGTPIAASLTIPLNQDLFTAIGLENLNGGVFQQFFGVLDANGLGQATLRWPAGLPLPPMTTHLAAIVLDPAQAVFTGVTNAVTVELR